MWSRYLAFICSSDRFDPTVQLCARRSQFHSLVSLHGYLKERKKQKSKAKQDKEQAELLDDHVTSWLPGTLNHKISIQANGGTKSRPLSVTLPGRTPIPLYSLVSLFNNTQYVVVSVVVVVACSHVVVTVMVR